MITRRNTPRRTARTDLRRAFTLIEMLTAVAVLTLMMSICFAVVGQVTGVWKQTSQKIEAFQGARMAFETLTRHLSHATLNTYLDYDNPTSPQNYLRKSELRYLSAPAGVAGIPGTVNTGQAIFFQAPAHYTNQNTTYGGLESLLNTCGYYISFTTNNLPAHVTAPNPPRYRLMQLLVPTEQADSVYPYSANSTSDWATWFASKSWFANYTTLATPVADNIIALIIRAQDPASTTPDITTNYTYDTTLNASVYPQPVWANQLPPVLQVTLIAIDEASALRLQNGTSEPNAISHALAGKFVTPANYISDLNSVESALTAAHIQYRVFATAVTILESKWTK